jgi:hypothetical protein
VGEQGRAVGQQLARLLPGLDAARRAGVALIAVDEGGRDDDERLLGTWLDAERMTSDETDPLDAPILARFGTPLPLLMVEALRGQDPRDVLERQEPRRGVLDDLVMRRIREAGYTVPRAMVVVWVAASASSPSLVHVTREIRAALQSEDVEGWVLLALPNIYPRNPELRANQAQRCRDQRWQELLLGTPGEPALATYGYLFEAHGEHGTFWEGADDVPFAAAEAIFVLAASGITTTREFEDTLRQSLPQLVENPYERLSGIGTSRLTFPRGHVEEFAASRLGAGVMREWARSRKVSLPLVAEGEHKRAARNAIAEVRHRISDNGNLRRGGRSSPRLSADTVARARGIDRPAPDGGLMFRHFSAAELARLDDGRLTLEERLEFQRAKADEGFPIWKSTIRPGWERYGQTMERQFAAYADDLILRGPEGVAQARTYADELNRQLNLEREELARRREGREVAYERYLLHMEDVTHGPWERSALWQERQAQQAWRAQAAEPAIQALVPAPATNPLSPVLASMPLTLGEMTAEPEAPTREEQLISALAGRHVWMEARIPQWPALLGLGMMMVPPWVLLAQALLPARWMSGTWSVLILTVAIVLLTAVVCAGYRELRMRQAAAAADDLRGVYRRTFARRCERHEDQRREALLVGLHARVRRMVDRLADWDSFATGLAERLDAEARQIERELFEGAIGRRDVVVANRQLLHPDDYNLHHLEDDVSAKRRAQPVEGAEWHASAATMLEPMREHLRGTVSLMGSAPEAIVAPVRAFCLQVVRPYVSGEIVDLGAALEAMPIGQTAGLFDHLIERSSILFHPVDRPRPPMAFVAARDEHHDQIRERSQAANMVPLTLHDREWMGVLRLQPGGSLPSFHDVEGDRRQLEQHREGVDPVLSQRRTSGELGTPRFEQDSMPPAQNFGHDSVPRWPQRIPADSQWLNDRA